MATATYTTHYNWVQPALGGDPTTWGSEINTSLGAIDSQVWTNDQKVVTIQGYLGPHQFSITRQGAAYGNLIFGNQDVAVGQQLRWVIQEDIGAEGGNANSNLTVHAYSDAGVYLGYAMQFIRATQRVSIAQAPVGANDIAHKNYVDGQITAAVNTAGAAVAANHGILPVGSIIMWPVGADSAGNWLPVPPGWVGLYGQHYKYTDYPALFNVLGGIYFWDGTNFGLPNMINRAPFGWDGSKHGTGNYVGSMGGEATHQISIAEMPGHDHGYSQTPHGHPASQDGHVHYDSGHGHGINDPGHDHGFAFHTVFPSAGISSGANVGNLGQTTHDATGISIQAGSANIGGASANGVYITVENANISFSGQGNWAAHNNIPPYTVLNFLIRYA